MIDQGLRALPRGRLIQEARDYELVFVCGSPYGGQVTFLAAGDKPAMVELIPCATDVEGMWSATRRGYAGWDGRVPLRGIAAPQPSGFQGLGA